MRISFLIFFQKRISTVIIPVLSFFWSVYTKTSPLLMITLFSTISFIILFFLKESFDMDMKELKTKLIVEDEEEVELQEF